MCSFNSVGEFGLSSYHRSVLKKVHGKVGTSIFTKIYGTWESRHFNLYKNLLYIRKSILLLASVAFHVLEKYYAPVVSVSLELRPESLRVRVAPFFFKKKQIYSNSVAAPALEKEPHSSSHDVAAV